MNESKKGAAKSTGNGADRASMLLKATAGMDEIGPEKKAQCISFANAMNAIEGVPISSQLASELAAWQNGSKSFHAVFVETLQRYGFAVEDHEEQARGCADVKEEVDPFYSESNIRYLERKKREIDEGRAHFAEHELPFEVMLDEPNAVTCAAMEAAEKGEDMYGPFDSVADLMEALDTPTVKDHGSVKESDLIETSEQ